MSEIKRYEQWHDCDNNGGMEEDECGGFVKHNDHLAAIHVKDDEIDSLWSTLIKIGDYLKINTEKARKNNGKPSDVYIAAIEQARIDAVREFQKHLIDCVANRVHKNWIVNPLNGIESPGVEEIKKRGFSSTLSEIKGLSEQFIEQLKEQGE